MAEKKGTLSINSDNIFPIIKKWLYSDHDIFARELVSNGCDAITKLKKLDMMGEYQLPDDYKPAIKVEVNPEEKTLKFTDNGLGIKKEEIPHLFDRFFRSENVRNKDIDGSGIGLSIAKVICDSLKYKLEVDSEYGKWTEFKISIPIDVD